MSYALMATVITYERAIEELTDLSDSLMARIEFLESRIEVLKDALRPLAEKHLYPDDIDEAYAASVRAEEDWDEEASDEMLDNCWIARKWVKAARAALDEKK